MERSRKDIDFCNYPGSITSNMYVFPTLYSRDSNGKVRYWKIQIRLVNKNKIKKKYNINWSLTDDEVIPIHINYLKIHDIPQNAIAQMWNEAGQLDGKTTRYHPSFITKGSYQNTNRKDRQTPFTQALIKAKSLYNSKVDKGFVLNIDEVNVDEDKLYPMALHNFSNGRIDYPVYVQRKYDGVRVMSYYKKGVIMYSRRKKVFTLMNHIREQLEIVLSKFKNLYLDGEFYSYKCHLQQISGDVRNEEKDTTYLKLYIFDCVNLNESSNESSNESNESNESSNESSNAPFEKRLLILQQIDELIKTHHLNHLIVAKTFKCQNEKEVFEYYNKFLKEKYEGAVVRNYNSKYETSKFKEKRSYTTVKLKPNFDDEFEIIGFTEGIRGKDVGAIIWKLKTKDGKVFTAVDKDRTYDERYELFNKYKNNPELFEADYKGKMMTVEYQDLSKNKTPQRAKAKAVRDVRN